MGPQIENDLGKGYSTTACSFFAKKDIFTFRIASAESLPFYFLSLSLSLPLPTLEWIAFQVRCTKSFLRVAPWNDARPAAPS